MMMIRRIASPIVRQSASVAAVASRGMATTASAVTYTEHGDPNRVLSYVNAHWRAVLREQMMLFLAVYAMVNAESSQWN